jgi:transcriptional regulator with XRE-family HTH domain
MARVTRYGGRMKFQSALLRTERTRRDMTIEELAAAAGVNWRTVSRAELGEGTPSLDTAMALARALDIPLDKLCTTNGADKGEAA